MKIKTLVLLILAIPFLVIAQNKQDYVWFFSRDNDFTMEGIQSYRFDFKDTIFDIKLGVSAFAIDNNNASICDEEGNLLIYTNGCAVANALDQMMPNGDSINAGVFLYDFWDGCEYGYPGIQNIMIINDPGNSYGYYIIHKPIYLEST